MAKRNIHTTSATGVRVRRVAMLALTLPGLFAFVACGAPADRGHRAWIATGGPESRGDIAVLDDGMLILLSPVWEPDPSPEKPGGTCDSTRFTLGEIERGPLDLTSTGGTDGYIVLATATISEDQTSLVWTAALDPESEEADLGPGVIEIEQETMTVENIPYPGGVDITFVRADSSEGEAVVAEVCRNE
ncbi:hypothetical protein [Microbacterium natoriense]